MHFHTTIASHHSLSACYAVRKYSFRKEFTLCTHFLYQPRNYRYIVLVRSLSEARDLAKVSIYSAPRILAPWRKYGFSTKAIMAESSLAQWG